MTFQLLTFGGLRLEADATVVTGPPAQRRRLALLALLAGSDDQRLSREKAFGYLWPEQSTRRARHLLSESLYVLRRFMGEEVIRSIQDELVLNTDLLWSDVAAFRDGVACGADEDSVRLYRGPFLDGFFLRDAPEFERWVEVLRDGLSHQFARTLEGLAERATARGDALSATEWWRRLAAHDPYSSRIASRYLEALAASGERAQAIQFAATHAARLRAELGVDPEPEFDAILARLQQRTTRGPTAGDGQGSGADGVANPDVGVPASQEWEEPAQALPNRIAEPSSLEPPRAVAPAGTDASGGAVTGSASRSAPTPWRRRGVAGLAVLMVSALVMAQSRGVAPVPVLGPVRAVSFEPGIEIGPSLSPDGQYIAYAGGTPSRIYLRQPGSRPILLVAPDSGPPQARPRWSPDGTQIAFDSGRRIFVIPALGGVPRRIVEQGWSPTWSPDGRRVAYALGDTIFAVDVGGGRPVPLGVVIQPAELSWSPDGRWIALTAGNDAWNGQLHAGNVAHSRIVLVAVDDGRLIEVTDRSALNVAPTWGPDGRELLFISNRAGARDIYRVTLDSDGIPAGEPERLSTGLDAHSMSLSSAGDRLVYATFRGRANIWSLRITPGATTRIADAVPLTTGNQIIESISVSPDRRWLYFTSDRSGNSDIWRMPLGGGDAVQVTHDPADEFAPEQSPDGEWLAFYSLQGGTRDLWVRPTGPGEAVRLTEHPEEEHDPHWSPDGTRICYSQSGASAHSVRLLRRQGNTWSEPLVLSDSRGQPYPFWCRGWLPDGRRVVLQDASRSSIAVLPVDGGPPQTIYSWDSDRGRPQPIWVRVEARTGAILFRDWVSIWMLEPPNPEPRLLVQLDEPSRQSTRIEMDSDGEHVFLSLGDPQGDLFMIEVSRPRQ